LQLYRLLARLGRALQRAGDHDGIRPAKLDLARFSEHDLHDLGLSIDADRDLWLSAPWQSGSQIRYRPGRLPPI
jgi:uncharacterized protein YjiS (DUF1127 family)